MQQYTTKPNHPRDAKAIAPEHLRDVWCSSGEVKRREKVQEVLDLFDHDWHDRLDAELSNLFQEQNYQKLRLRIDTSINLLAWACDELGSIYSEPAARTINNNEDGLGSFTNEGELDAAYDEAARICFATRQIIMRPLVVERDGKNVIVMDLVTPDKVCIIPNAQDPLRIDAIAVQISDSRWSIWTDDSHWVVGRDWKIIREETPDDESNPYGMIPYVLCHARYPSRKRWTQNKTNGLVEATYQAGIGKTDHQHLRHFQSFKQLYIVKEDGVSGDEGKKLADPTSVMVLRGPTAKIGTVDMQANLSEHLESLMQGAQATLALYGIRPEAVRGTIDASSGYALSLKMHKQQQAWGSYRRAWARNERAVYRVARVVWAIDAKGKQLPDGKLEIEYAELGPGQDPMEQATRAEKLLSIGWSEGNVYREVFGKDDEWIKANAKERQDEKKRNAEAFGTPPQTHGSNASLSPDASQTAHDDDTLDQIPGEEMSA